MLYAKIDSDGNVIEFPYRSRELDDLRLRSDQTLPDDAVVVDTEANRPTLKWDQKTSVVSAERSGDSYVAVYSDPVDRFDNHADRAKNISDRKRIQLTSNQRNFVAKVSKLKDEYSSGETESWPIQRSEAMAFNADNTADTPLLSVIAAARGITVDDLVTKILVNVAAYDAAYGELLGKYQKNKDILSSIDLDDESTWDLIDSIERL